MNGRRIGQILLTAFVFYALTTIVMALIVGSYLIRSTEGVILVASIPVGAVVGWIWTGRARPQSE